jgi:hypothetical protein
MIDERIVLRCDKCGRVFWLVEILPGCKEVHIKL